MSQRERRPLIIRPATGSDIPAIAAIYGHHVETGLASFELERPSNDEMLRRHLDIVGKGFPYLVAVDGGRVVGYAYASTYRARPAYRFTVENSVYIDSAAQRTGAGRALLGAVIGECERLACGMRVRARRDDAGGRL